MRRAIFQLYSLNYSLVTILVVFEDVAKVLQIVFGFCEDAFDFLVKQNALFALKA